jgi:hypothetical protein
MSEETDDLKDIYAQFGLTFSHGNNVENILANLILTTDFVKMVVEESKKAGKPIYTREQMSREFDLYLAKQHKKTMGALIGGPERRPGGLKDFITLDPKLDARVEDALRRRNYLAHEFWRERGGEVISVRRRDLVYADLEADQAFFEELAKDLEALALEEVRKLGLNADKLKTKVDEGVKELHASLRGDPPWAENMHRPN